MKTAIFASAALVAAVAAESVGDAVVVNKCSYPVYLYDTPASGGGYTEVDKVLNKDDSYTTQWTELSNGAGWSIKLSNSTELTYILQYEYTFQNEGTIWYDLSEVNGNPWDGNWEITSNTDTCSPRQAAYRYATDDAYGMQSCPQDATITVTLCSGDSEDDTSSASASASATTVASTSSAAAPSTSSYDAPSTTSAPAPSTTLATSVITSSASADNGGYDVIVTVTEVVATTTAWEHTWGKKRDAHAHNHGARHPHHRN